MIAAQFARFLADFVIFLQFTDEDALHPDDALKMEEYLACGLEELDKHFLRELVDSFEEIAPEYEGEAQQAVRDIAYYYSLEEAIAADDPVRLAQLEAFREARDG